MHCELRLLEHQLTDLEGEFFPRWADLARCEAALARMARSSAALVMIERGDFHPGRRIMRLRRRWWGSENEHAAWFDMVAATLPTTRWEAADPRAVETWKHRCASGWGDLAGVGLGRVGDEMCAVATHLRLSLSAYRPVRLRWDRWIDTVTSDRPDVLTRHLGRVGCTYSSQRPDVCVLHVAGAVSAVLAPGQPGVTMWETDVDVADLLLTDNENERKD